MISSTVPSIAKLLSRYLEQSGCRTYLFDLSRVQHDFRAFGTGVEEGVALRAILQRKAVRDDERRIDFAFLDPIQKGFLPCVHIRRPRLERQTFHEHGAQG